MDENKSETGRDYLNLSKKKLFFVEKHPGKKQIATVCINEYDQVVSASRLYIRDRFSGGVVRSASPRLKISELKKAWSLVPALASFVC